MKRWWGETLSHESRVIVRFLGVWFGAVSVIRGLVSITDLPKAWSGVAVAVLMFGMGWLTADWVKFGKGGWDKCRDHA